MTDQAHGQRLTGLLPCPFCGGSPVVVEIEPHSHKGGIADFMPDHPGSAYIDCACGVGLIDASAEDVVARWNNRPVPAPVGLERETVADRIIGQIEARNALAGRSIPVVNVDHLGDGISVLENLADSIRKHGNYSPETTLTFLGQAVDALRACRRPAECSEVGK